MLNFLAVWVCPPPPLRLFLCSSQAKRPSPAKKVSKATSKMPTKASPKVGVRKKSRSFSEGQSLDTIFESKDKTVTFVTRHQVSLDQLFEKFLESGDGSFDLTDCQLVTSSVSTSVEVAPRSRSASDPTGYATPPAFFEQKRPSPIDTSVQVDDSYSNPVSLSPTNIVGDQDERLFFPPLDDIGPLTYGEVVGDKDFEEVLTLLRDDHAGALSFAGF